METSVDNSLPRLLDRFAGLNVVVIGEAILDSYLKGAAGRLCREAPVPIVSVSSRKDVPGGAANTAANIRSLGGQVTFLSVIGDDAEGALLTQTLADCGISTEYLLAQTGRRTLAKHRVIADSQMLVRFDQGDVSPIGPDTEQQVIDSLAAVFPICDVLVISDYGYGTLTHRVIQALADLQARSPRLIIADAKNLAGYRSVGITAAKPNYEEAVQLLGGRPVDGANTRVAQILEAGERLHAITGAQIVAVTLDSDGAIILERGRPPYRTYARPTRYARAAGAGDTFVAAFALALAAGGYTPAAAELASAAAAIVVGKDGTATCSDSELRQYLSPNSKYTEDLSRLITCVEHHRQQGHSIVFTNGCFDILHRGHVTYLNRAKALGDVLIVGVNADESVRRLKGPGRPINTLDDRVQVLAALSCVDYIAAFADDTPSDLIRLIRPDIFAKGGDYTQEMLPEAPLVEELGGSVRILPYVEDRSTTGIIERIRETYGRNIRGLMRGRHGS